MTGSTSPQLRPPVLVAKELTKAYPGIRAADKVSLVLEAGTVHGLVGVNGAGKSTVLKMITGVIRPDRGAIAIDGNDVHLHTPRDARRLGIAAVHQEPSLVAGLDPVSNVYLGQQLHTLGFRRRRAMQEAFDASCDELGLHVPSRGPCRALPLSMQQQIEIIRAFQQRSRVLVLDEPTAALGQRERIKLLSIVRRIRDQGTSVVFISHHLEEVLDVCDQITVLRAGRVSAHGAVAEFSKASLTAAIVGRALGAVEPRRPSTPREHTPAVLELRDVVVGSRLRIPRLEVARGEVVGLVGLVGSGRTRLLRCIAGLDRPTAGRMMIHGRNIRWPSSPRRAIAAGIALAPEDRRTEGLILGQAAWSNVATDIITRTARLGLVSGRVAFRAAAALATAVGLPPDRLKVLAGTLSGGNQQKVVLGKLLGARAHVLLVDEPMRGVDVGAKEEIFRAIASAAADGASVLVASEDTEDLLAFCDRVIVLRRGAIAATVAGTESRDRVYRAMLGQPFDDLPEAVLT